VTAIAFTSFVLIDCPFLFVCRFVFNFEFCFVLCFFKGFAFTSHTHIDRGRYAGRHFFFVFFFSSFFLFLHLLLRPLLLVILSSSRHRPMLFLAPFVESMTEQNHFLLHLRYRYHFLADLLNSIQFV